LLGFIYVVVWYNGSLLCGTSATLGKMIMPYHGTKYCQLAGSWEFVNEAKKSREPHWRLLDEKSKKKYVSTIFLKCGCKSDTKLFLHVLKIISFYRNTVSQKVKADKNSRLVGTLCIHATALKTPWLNCSFPVCILRKVQLVVGHNKSCVTLLATQTTPLKTAKLPFEKVKAVVYVCPLYL